MNSHILNNLIIFPLTLKFNPLILISCPIIEQISSKYRLDQVQHTPNLRILFCRPQRGVPAVLHRHLASVVILGKQQDHVISRRVLQKTCLSHISVVPHYCGVKAPVEVNVEVTRFGKAGVWHEKETVVGHVRVKFGVIYRGRGLVNGVKIAIVEILQVSFIHFSEDVGQVAFGHVVSTVVQASVISEVLDCTRLLRIVLVIYWKRIRVNMLKVINPNFFDVSTLLFVPSC